MVLFKSLSKPMSPKMRGFSERSSAKLANENRLQSTTGMRNAGATSSLSGFGACLVMLCTWGCAPTWVEPTDESPTDNIGEPEAQQKTDVLLVVDNSGSMCEEQANLVANFYDADCPISDLDDVPNEFKNPSRSTIENDLANCGFVQFLAAFDNDYRVGVITTDVGQCDNRYSLAEDEAAVDFICGGQTFPDWGRRPQRGCLQGVPGRSKKFIEAGDGDVSEAFANTLANVQTFGSGFERGLDAMEVFLDENSQRAPGCEDDMQDFIRPDAKLLVIFISDEDDCSHRDGAFGAVDENLGESCASPRETPVEVRAIPTSPGNCYDRPDTLAPVSGYADFLNKLKGREGDVSVAVIAGATLDDNGEVHANGCNIGAAGQPAGECLLSRGNSSFCASEENCCTADGGDRYFQFASLVAKSSSQSICHGSFRESMQSLAEFVVEN